MQNQKLIASVSQCQSEEYFKAIIQNSSDVVIILDKLGVITYASPSVEHVLGYRADELIGKSCLELIASDDKPRAIADFGKALLVKDALIPNAFRIRHKNGAERILEGVGNNFLDDPIVAGFVMNVRDITDRRQAEIKVRRYELLAKRHRDVILFIDQDRGHILDANDAATRVYGYRHEELLMMTIHDLRAPGIDRLTAEQLAMANDEGLLFETIHRRQDGSTFPVEVSVQGSEIDGRRMLISVIRDITDRKRIEQLLEEQAKRAAATNKELESFSYSVSHDLRAPLRAIGGFSRMILKRGAQFDDETRRLFQVITQNTEMMDRLIDDLLNFSRLNQREMIKAELDMAALVQDVWQELVTINPDRAMTLKTNPMPPAFGDASLIRQVYSNLLGNAVKFTKTRETAVIEVGNTVNDHETVCFIRDNGVGFDMKYHDKLFGVFQRLHSQDGYEGTGIGLALVQRIINRHGGRVWAEAEVDKGATFFFTLPMRQ